MSRINRTLPLLMLVLALSACGGGGGAGGASTTAPPGGGTTAAPFDGSIILGRPTLSSIRASVLSASQSGAVWIAYGTAKGVYDKQSATATLIAGKPTEVALDGLSPNTRYYYRLYYQATGASSSSQGTECAFHTTRPPGSSFTFTIQADSHLDENSDLALYRRTLENVLADSPDFHIDLGDTFMTEKHSQPLTATVQMASSAATVNSRYAYERGNFGTMAHSVPLFLVNGNHDGELGWLNDGTAQNLAAWATQARKQYFLNPTPDAFYGGDSVSDPIVGERAAWYAWQWGDALFIVLDPYWSSPAQASKDAWNLTLGERQYRWLASTLAASAAKYKFVFIHNLVGGLDGQMRGGVEAAPYFEWGGRSSDGTYSFDQKRPGWGTPIHALLVKSRVTAVFHGHDHLYAHQVLDGLAYQEVPQPSASNTTSGPTLARDYHYNSGVILSSSGHLRVTVAPSGVTVQYVRAWLPASENAQRKNGQVDDSWTIPAAGN